mmetsp:Transcript_33192/g.77585  ORF Transcript_33192/g.77585 Transcript_33192/m.77585 type:complete len:249 (+) Transcript_33192:277-1023(+)
MPRARANRRLLSALRRFWHGARASRSRSRAGRRVARAERRAPRAGPICERPHRRRLARGAKGGRRDSARGGAQQPEPADRRAPLLQPQHPGDRSGPRGPGAGGTRAVHNYHGGHSSRRLHAGQRGVAAGSRGAALRRELGHDAVRDAGDQPTWPCTPHPQELPRTPRPRGRRRCRPVAPPARHRRRPPSRAHACHQRDAHARAGDERPRGADAGGLAHGQHGWHAGHQARPRWACATCAGGGRAVSVL